jgi:hypothetical protein
MQSNLIDATAPKNKPETGQMVVIHKALRREFGLLPGLVAEVPGTDTARAGSWPGTPGCSCTSCMATTTARTDCSGRS